MSSIRDVDLNVRDGRVQRLHATFGEHHFLELEEKDGKVILRLGQTHHGFSADASDVNGELEQIINTAMREHPKSAF